MRLLPSLLSALVLATAASAQLGNPVVPAGNPITPQKVLLGKALFWDEQLSATGTMACGSCHMPRYGGADGLAAHPEVATHPGLDQLFGTADDIAGSPGVVQNRADGSYEPEPLFGLEPQVTRRLAPSFINAAFFDQAQFWDGRADGVFRDPLTNAVVLAGHAALENQAADPPVSTIEMGHVGIDWNDVAARVQASVPLALATELPTQLRNYVGGHTYPQLFFGAFDSAAVTPARIVMAIATYERTLVSDQAPIDLNTLNPLQQQGGVVFDTVGRCVLCHNSPPGLGLGLLFSDRDFHNTGVRPIAEDVGRQAVTNLLADAGKFRTPSLRNVALRPRYMHNGRFATLMEVVEFYDRGGDFTANLDPLMQPLGLSQQQKIALVAYLESFTDPRVANETAPFDRPSLFRGSARQPQRFGVGTGGSGALVPHAIAIEPPYIQNPNLTFALGDGLGGALGALAVSLRSIPAGQPTLGMLLYLDPATILVGDVVVLEGTAGVAGAGFASYGLPLNVAPAFIGLDLFQQWFVADPAAPQGVASSEAFGLRLF